MTFVAHLALAGALSVPLSPPPPLAPTCQPLTNSGNCYQAGEFCRKADHGSTGTTALGEKIVCEDNDGWRWEPATGLIMQTIAIPRGQVVLAGGTAAPDDKRISVEARRGDTRFGICSTTFLEEAFRTDYYRIDITFNGDGSWT